MEIKLYTDVALTCDLPQHRLRRGDIVKVVDHHPGPGGDLGYSIEVINALGETVGVTAVPSGWVQPLDNNSRSVKDRS